jgi:ABC-type sugar transport system ATPase subunit
MNMLRMRALGSVLAGAADPKVRFPLGREPGLPDDGEIIVGVRAHQLRIAREGEPGVQVVVDLVEHLGRSNFVVCTPLSEGLLVNHRALVFESDANVSVEPKRKLTLTADPASLVFFNPTDGQALRPKERASPRSDVGAATAARGAIHKVESQ